MTFPIKKIALTFCAALMVVASSAGSAQADIYQHIDDLAVDIQAKSRLLARQSVHYRYTPQYRSIVMCTRKLYRLARHIHEVTHFQGNLVHLQADLQDLEFEFDALENLFDRTELYAARGCSRVAGNTAHVKELLNALEDCIHLMREDVDQLVAESQCPSRRARPAIGPQHRGHVPSGQFHPNYSRFGNSGYLDADRRSIDPRVTRTNGYGLSIGGGSTRIQFRF